MSLALGFGTNVFDVQGLLTLSLQLQLHGPAPMANAHAHDT
jgi:hypothetical protein